MKNEFHNVAVGARVLVLNGYFHLKRKVRCSRHNTGRGQSSSSNLVRGIWGGCVIEYLFRYIRDAQQEAEHD